VFGIYMHNWDPVDEIGGSACTTDADCEDARQVAKQLGIPFYEVSFVKEYWNHVFEPFLQAYTQGVTPNPDVYCNRHIKFDALLSKAKQLGADALATGHYARLQHQPDSSLLLSAVDGNKDQSYFLCMTSGQHLRDAVFPLGEWTKPQVRQHAQREGLLTANKQESMGICFVGKRRRFNGMSLANLRRKCAR
jgi:tRNA-specific 2-thiouridylase